MFDGVPHNAVNHVVRFVRYLSKQNITQPCDQMELFVLSIAPSIDWLESCKLKSIPSLPMLTTHFLLHERPSFQSYGDISQMLEMAIQMGTMIQGVAREGAGKRRDPHAIEVNLGRRKRHQSRGLDLILQPRDGIVNDQVYESLVKNYIKPIILRVRSERLKHV